MKRKKLIVVMALLLSISSGYTSVFANTSVNVSNVQLEAEYAKPEGSITLWENPRGTNYNRIPAITTTNDGTLLAINDLRYNNASDLGNHRIDLLLKKSLDNGKSWSEEINLTEKYTKDQTEDSFAYGYGDAAIVSDRDSDNILILAASGTPNFWHGDSRFISTRENPVNVGKITSKDGGKTFTVEENLTDEIYGLNQNWTRLFAASGRIMQSRYIKVGEYSRIYTAVLTGNGNSNAGNYVLYSDDFGDTWNVLGDGTSPVPAGDEAKIEELPNGNVVISSRTDKGRLINIFTYDKSNGKYSTGKWESTSKKLSLGNGSSCNGEIMIVYVRDKETGEYTHLALQSLPTLDGTRKGVGIYFKEVDKNIETVDQYIEGWSQDNFYMIQEKESAYSTMALQKDGSIGFLYEDRLRSGYDGQFLNLDIETITNNKYEIAFEGIGTKECPYLVETEEQFNAVKGVYSKERVNFLYSIEK